MTADEALAGLVAAIEARSWKDLQAAQRAAAGTGESLGALMDLALARVGDGDRAWFDKRLRAAELR